MRKLTSYLLYFHGYVISTDSDRLVLFRSRLGMFSLRKRIEDSVLRAEMLAPTVLEFEEAKHVDQEEVVRDYDLWNDLSKSNEMLVKLADSAKVVDTLRDLTFKVPYANLSTMLFHYLSSPIVLLGMSSEKLRLNGTGRGS